MKAVIFGLEGKFLNDWEKKFFSNQSPAGFILFARNVGDPAQLTALTSELREVTGDAAIPILIDQEGGRVQRMGPPHWRKAPPAARFAELFDKDQSAGERACYLNAVLLGSDLIEAGITVDCAPVLDLRFEGAHDIIGDRAYGTQPDPVIRLGGQVCDGLLAAGVLPVIKHLPGHGRAMVDSHEDLPRVGASLADLQQSDFMPFRALSDAPWGMTAHIVYDCLDPRLPATQSKEAIDFIRSEIGFDGVLVSDDLSMKALAGSYAERAAAALAAGCDLVLHCNGNPDEMQAVADGCDVLNDAARERLGRAEALRRNRRQPLNRAILLEELARLLGEPTLAQA